MKKIIITGASGFLGYPTLLKMSQVYKDTEIFALYNNRLITAINDNIIPIKINLMNESEYRRLPKSYDVVIHFAGQKETFLKNNSGLKQFDYNTHITKLLIPNMVKAHCKSMIYASSVYIYSGINQIPFVEKNLGIPNNYLGLSKLVCESLMRSYALEGVFNSICLRIFTVYGRQLSSKQFITDAINRLQSNSGKEIFFNPKIHRDFIHIDDVVESFINAMRYIEKQDADYFDSINVATGVSTSIEDLIKILIQLTNVKKKIKFRHSNYFSNDQDHIANINKIKKLFHWSPKIDLYEGLKTIVK